MEILSKIIEYIAETNLFNFVIFLSVIIFICKKIDVKSKLEEAGVEVKTTIDTSTVAKEESETRLHTIEDSLAGIGAEIDSILSKSEENANLVGKKLLSDAEKSAETIKDNAEKAIENSRNILRNELIKRASLASVEVARNHIINELRNNTDLHNKLIDESVKAIEDINDLGVELG